MADPQTPARGLYIPTRGADAGTWDLPVNSDFSAIDSLVGNIATIGLTNAPVTLTTAPNSGASWSGPYQAQSGILRLTGTLSGNVTVTIPVTGFFIVENLCTVGAFYVALASSAPGRVVCAPPGEACHIYCDGTDVKYVNMGRVGAYLDLAISTVPAWITNSSTAPYLLCDGTVYTATAVYGVGRPAPLLNFLGSTFGGNGVTTFGVPDVQARSRISLGGATGRVTAAVSGIDGTILGSSGGDQRMQQHLHVFTGTQQTWSSNQSTYIAAGYQGARNDIPNISVVSSSTSTQGPVTTTITPAGTISNTGAGASQNMPPTFVSGITLIKT